MDDDNVLTINKGFAKNYDRYRQKEELQKLKDKYGDISEDNSSSETEDEDAEALTEEVEKDWLRTFAAVKSRDPKIYKKNVQFYGSGSEKGTSPKQSEKKTEKKKDKPLTLKDYERKVILEKGGVLSDEEEEPEQSTSLGYYEEQEEIKKSIKKVLVSSDESDDDLLVQRQKTEEETVNEEDEYRNWLKGQKSNLKESETFGEELLPLKTYWTDPKLEEDEKFLRDYILNKDYLEKDKDRIPTYDEIVEDAGFSEEEDILQKQEDFEMKYNFRYEEPDPEFIKSYPRTIADSVRRSDNKRAKSRLSVKDRKEMEKEMKIEELKQLKNLKKKEILDKMDRLKSVTGNQSLGMLEADLDGDFDPEKYDKLMQKVFDSDYYGLGEEEKPVFTDDEELGLEGDWDNWQGGDNFGQYGGGEGGVHVDDPNFNMDADFDPNAAPVRNKKESKKQKRKSKFAQAVLQTKPVFDPSEKSFEKYFEEYYKLDYEDIIGDLPCRFKYRKTVPNDYGLTVQEILAADDKDLNSWCSVKKMSQYKGEEEEYTDLKKYKKKAKKKYNVLTSLKNTGKPAATISSAEAEQRLSENMEEDEIRSDTNQKGKETVTEGSDNEDNSLFNTDNSIPSTDTGVESSERLSNNQSPKKRKKKKKHPIGDVSDRKSQKLESSMNQDSAVLSENDDSSQTSTVQKSKKRKHGVKNISQSEDMNTDSDIGNTKLQNNDAISIESDFSSEVASPKKKKKGEKSETIEGSKEKVSAISNVNNKKHSKNKRLKKKKKKQDPVISDERLKAYGINPKRFKHMQKMSKDLTTT